MKPGQSGIIYVSNIYPFYNTVKPPRRGQFGENIKISLHYYFYTLYYYFYVCI